MRFAPHPASLRQLQYIVAVADRRSFRKAAAACRVAQPSLSAQVALAESSLGVTLFERLPREVRLTAAGAAIVAKASAILRLCDDLSQYAQSLSEPEQGTVRVGVIPTVAPYLLPELAPALRRRFPKLAVIWTEDKTPALMKQLGGAELDAVLIAAESGLESLASVELGRDPFVFVAPKNHALAKSTRPIGAAELEGEQVLLLDDGHCFRDQALAVCAQGGITESNYRATSLPTLAQMAAAGIGLTFLPRLALGAENRQGLLRARPVLGESSHRTLVLAWPTSSPLERTLKAVGESFRQVYAQRIAGGQ